MEKSPPPQRHVVAWVFQGARFYDIDRYLSRQTFVYWMYKRFQDQMQLGMPAFIKRSGPNNGIIALGSVALQRNYIDPASAQPPVRRPPVHGQPARAILPPVNGLCTKGPRQRIQAFHAHGRDPTDYRGFTQLLGSLRVSAS